MKRRKISVFVALLLAFTVLASPMSPVLSVAATQAETVETLLLQQDVSASPKNAIDLTWDAVADAVRYDIYMYDTDKWTVGDSATEETTKRIESLDSSATYFLRVQAVNAQMEVIAVSDVLTAQTAPDAVENIKAVIAGDKCSVSWDPVALADGYAVYANGDCIANVPANECTFAAKLLTDATISVAAYSYIDGVACEGDAVQAIVIAENTKKENITLGLGETVSLSAFAFGTATYLSADPLTVSVADNGVATAEKCGKAQVLVRTAAGDVAVDITVLPAATAVRFAEQTKTLYVGETADSELMLDGAGAWNRTYKSDNDSVVTVDENGILKAVKEGTAKITVTLFNNVSADMTVTVVGNDQLYFEKQAFALGVGEQMKNLVLSDGAVVKNVRYSGMDSIVSISADGVITALATGTATLTATAADGRSASCTVKVIAAPQKITLSKSDSEIGVGMTLKLTAQITPTFDSSKIKWTSDNSEVASVSNGVVTANAAGDAKITATLYNGVTASCYVTVLAAPKKLQLNKTSHSLYVGDVHKLTAIAEVDAYVGTLTFRSSASSVLSVDSNGNAKALRTGTATVTVTAYNGVSATCTYTITERATKVTVTSSAMNFGVGMYSRMTAVTDTGLGLEGAVWTVSDESIATLNEEHHLIAKKAGKVTVTVTLTNGVKGTCTVNIQAAPTSVTLDKTSLNLDINGRYRLTATVNSGAYPYAITYASTNDDIARVAADGTVIAVAAGTVTVTAKTYNGKKATCTVTVAAPPTSVKFEYSSYSQSQGSWFYVKLFNQNNAEYTNATFKSSDTSVATVAAGGLVHVLKMGTATITATTANGLTATCRINVTRMNVKLISQLPNYPTGCEAASCAMLLGYYGYSYTTANMVSIIPRENIRYINGYAVGPDINEKFVGDPTCTYTSDTPGYGVFSPAVTKALQEAVDKKNGNHTAVRISGCTYNELLGYLADGYPIIVWSTYNMNVPSTVNAWYIDRGNGQYEYFEYPRGTHVTVLCGYDGSKVYMMDPYDNACLSFSSSTFKARWDLLGNQGVILK